MIISPVFPEPPFFPVMRLTTPELPALSIAPDATDISPLLREPTPLVIVKIPPLPFTDAPASSDKDEPSLLPLEPTEIMTEPA